MHSSLLTAAVLATTAHAQLNLTTLGPPSSNNTFMNITFSDPRAADCGRSSTAQNESATIYIQTLAGESVCMDLDYIFTHPNETFAPGETHPDVVSDGQRYTVGDAAVVGWSPDTYNYSQIFYSQRRANLDNAADSSKLGDLMLRAFSAAGCPGNGLNMSASPWYSWNCADENGQCSTVPFSVKSILLSGPTNNERPGDGGCVTAVEYNVGALARPSLEAVTAWVFTTVAALLLL